MRIGEVARQVGVATSAIRFYENAGLLPSPRRTAAGYRDYDSSVIDRLEFIRAGQAVGLTLIELKDVLHIRDQGEAPCQHVTELIDARIAEVDERMRDLQRLRRNLVALADTAAATDPAECSPEGICQILTGVS